MLHRTHKIIANSMACFGILAACCGYPASGQTPVGDSMVEQGKITVNGKPVAYRIRNLPIGSFPDLPPAVADALSARNCVIPQTYQAHHPENVIHGSFEHSGSSDWAALCSADGRISLLVFFASASQSEPQTLVTAAKTECLQPHNPSGELGFDWGIDPASPKRIHEAQAGLAHRPPSPDHDGLAESILDQKTIYHLFKNGEWDKLETE